MSNPLFASSPMRDDRHLEPSAEPVFSNLLFEHLTKPLPHGIGTAPDLRADWLHSCGIIGEQESRQIKEWSRG